MRDSSAPRETVIPGATLTPIAQRRCAVVRDPVVRDPVVRDPVVRDPVDRDAVVRDRVILDPVCWAGAWLRTVVLSCVLSAAVAGCAAMGKCGIRECPADAKISADVRALLAQSPSLGSPSPISVRTTDGVVYLRGLVSTPYQIAEGGALAERVPGVVSVQNQLTIDNSH